MFKGIVWFLFLQNIQMLDEKNNTTELSVKYEAKANSWLA